MAALRLPLWNIALFILLCLKLKADAQTGNLFGQTFDGDVSPAKQVVVCDKACSRGTGLCRLADAYFIK